MFPVPREPWEFTSLSHVKTAAGSFPGHCFLAHLCGYFPLSCFKDLQNLSLVPLALTTVPLMKPDMGMHFEARGPGE